MRVPHCHTILNAIGVGLGVAGLYRVAFTDGRFWWVLTPFLLTPAITTDLAFDRKARRQRAKIAARTARPVAQQIMELVPQSTQEHRESVSRLWIALATFCDVVPGKLRPEDAIDDLDHVLGHPSDDPFFTQTFFKVPQQYWPNSVTTWGELVLRLAEVEGATGLRLTERSSDAAHETWIDD